MGSIIFVSLEGDHSEYTNIGETAVAASKPYPRNDLENSDIRSRWNFVVLCILSMESHI